MLRKELKKKVKKKQVSYTQLCHGGHRLKASLFISPRCSRKLFLTHLDVSTIPMQPAFPLQARLKFLNNLLVIFILMIAFLKKNHIDQCPIYGFQGMLPFGHTTSKLIYFHRCFKYLPERTQKRKSFNKVQENI